MMVSEVTPKRTLIMGTRPPALAASLGLLLAALAAPCGAATLVVDPAGHGDFTEIQLALDLASDGDTVLVVPGEYLLSRPLDLNRLHLPAMPGSPPVKKNLVLRAPGGPDQTILWMSDQPEDPRRGCVVIFQKGEGPGTVLEGFTIAGGRGTDVGGFPVGGGVLCLGSSPTLRNLAVTENEGGVYVRGGAPVLSDSLIAYNLLSGISAGEGSSLT